jgi:hypothetical protein
MFKVEYRPKYKRGTEDGWFLYTLKETEEEAKETADFINFWDNDNEARVAKNF